MPTEPNRPATGQDRDRHSNEPPGRRAARRLLVGSLLLCVLAVLVTATVGPSREVRPAAQPADQDSSSLEPLIDVLVQRMNTGDTVAAAKWPTRGPVEDRAREKTVLDAAAAASGQRHLDPARVAAVFADQIEASKTVQYGLFSRWTATPDIAPRTSPDLKKIRPVLDRLTARLLDQLAATAPTRTAPGCDAAVRAAADQAARRSDLDPLHRAALSRAVRSLCT